MADRLCQLIQADALAGLRSLATHSVDCCVTSPPYYKLRDYGVVGQLGQEKSPAEYVARLVAIFAELYRVLKPAGTFWLILGDSYASRSSSHNHSLQRSDQEPQSGPQRYKYRHSVKRIGVNRANGLRHKQLIGIPWRVALALSDWRDPDVDKNQWLLRQEIIWRKPNPMPESVKDRCTRSHETIFMFTKGPRYYYDAKGIEEPVLSNRLRQFIHQKPTSRKKLTHRDNGFDGRYADKLKQDGIPTTRNCRSVWTLSTRPFKEAHFAVFPPELPRRCLLAGCPEGGVVIDPFCGSCTTGMVAQELGLDFIGIDLNNDYIELAERRLGLPCLKREVIK